MDQKLYAARRRRNAITMGLSVAATAFGLGWLVLILGVLLYEGFSGLSLAVFTEMTPPPGSTGGLLNPGTSIASTIANEFGEALDPLHRSSLLAVGFVLFVLTLVVLALSLIHI